MKRRADWPERLAAFLESRHETEKTWGYNDCGMFYADAILAMTGTDVGWELRGEYRSGREALRTLVKYFRKRGLPMPAWQHQPDSLLGEIAEHFARVYGFESIELALAQRGDAVLLDVSELLNGPSAPVGRSGQITDEVIWTRALGIMGMNGLPVTVGMAGIVELPAEWIVKAWRI